MTQELKYPYQLINTFIISISFNRSKKLSGKFELPTSVGVQYTEPGFPRIQVAMKVDVPKDFPVSFSLEVAGLFDYIGSKKEYDKGLNREFIEQRAFHMLWVYCSQIVKLVSSQMGMAPLEMRSPATFALPETIQPTTENPHDFIKKRRDFMKRKATKKTS
jgi:hypothetical protein